MTWFGQSVIAMVILTPCWLAVGFFERNFGFKPDVYVVWYFFGIALSVAGYTAATDKSGLERLFPSWQLVFAVIAVGATIGAAANLLLFTAVANAPNASLPSTIANGGGGALVFLTAIFLGEVIPKYFGKSEVSWQAIMGLVLVIAGMGFLGYAKR